MWQRLTRTLFSGIWLALVPLAVQAAPKVITIAFGESMPPYVIQESNSGLEMDIVRAALKAQGYDLTPVYYSQARLRLGLRSSRVDGIATVNDVPGNLSDIYIRYEDVAITLAERHLLLRSIEDLAHYRVLGFPQAAHYLGKRYYAMAQRNPNYSEPPNQLDQNRLLYHNAADVVVADRRIYHWMDRQLQQVYNERPRPVEEHALFMRVPYRVVFRSATVRDAFNAGLRTIQKNGQYAQILNHYP
ncbi:MAG TPA: transporter substrate-binding domain-containing protein [Chromobacteriaceae bacterium]|nr:transporter substrate-binding domain-containing protein [Chromobacteriaceae bacterium]